MSTTEKNSPVLNFFIGLVIFAVAPIIAMVNYVTFQSEDRGVITRSWVTGRRYVTFHQEIARPGVAAHELDAWNVLFGCLPQGAEVEKRAGSFWANSVTPSSSAWMLKPLSLAIFLIAVVLPLLAYIAVIVSALWLVVKVILWPFRAMFG